MVQTVQELIEQAKLREALFKTAKKGIRKERLEKFKQSFQAPQRFDPRVRKLDTRVSSVARKAVSLVSPKGSLIKAITTPKKKGRGRGRPRGTYKSRFVPGVGVVHVPTHIYKKMMAKAKADARLAQVQRQVEAEQIAMQQDPRFAPTDDSFLAEQDQVHEFNVAQAQLQAEQIQEQPQLIRKPGMAQRMIRGVSGFGTAIGRLGARQPPRAKEFGRQIQPQLFPQRQVQDMRPRQVQNMRPRQPRVTSISNKADILRIPNIFNNPRDSSILRSGRKKIY